jgi:uncharacterized protein (DUF1015 family)
MKKIVEFKNKPFYTDSISSIEEVSMATIKAFSCIRPHAQMEEKIAALPYDVCNRQEARDIIRKQPLSFLRVDKAESLLDDSVDPYDASVYDKANDVLHSMIRNGSLQKDPDSAMYLYELTMDGRSQTGLVCCASIDDYINGIIMKHENTRTDKENDRIRHIDTCCAQTGPIFLTYRSNRILNTLFTSVKSEKPFFDFTADDGVAHRGWKIKDRITLDTITQVFESVNQIYIADGHHRAASAVKVGQKRRASYPDYTGEEEFNYFLSVLFPDQELYIMDYNRVVHDLNGLSEAAFLSEVRRKFEITPAAEAVHPAHKGMFGMYLNDNWYQLKARPEILSDNPVDGLDVSVLQNELLAPVLGIQDPKTDQRISFVGGIRGLDGLEDTCRQYPHGVAFSMYPTSIQELFAVADAGLLMPPKSTWFEPKLRSGLFIHEIES